MAQSISLTAQTAYAELVDRTTTAAFAEAYAEDGAFVRKVMRGKTYWYFQSAGAGRSQRYVGPETDDLKRQIESHRNYRTDDRERRALVAMLVEAVNLPKPNRLMGEVVSALQKAGVFRLRGVLVGTMAFQVYPALLGVRLPQAATLTDDVDIAQHRTVSLAVGDKMEEPLTILKAVDVSFRAIPHRTHQTRVTQYRAASGLRVDFLTPNRGPDSDEPEMLPALSTAAEPLRFLDFLIHEPVRAALLHGAGVPVLVPSPERFAVHKLIVAQRRHAVADKKRKDVQQAEALFETLLTERRAELVDVWGEACKRGAKWRDLLSGGLAAVKPAIRDALLQAVGAVRGIVPGLTLAFAAPRAQYDFDRDIVGFWGEAGGERHFCAITLEALQDHFGVAGSGKDEVAKAFRENRDRIEQLAQAKYLRGVIETLGETIVKSADVTAHATGQRRKGMS